MATTRTSNMVMVTILVTIITKGNKILGATSIKGVIILETTRTKEDQTQAKTSIKGVKIQETTKTKEDQILAITSIKLKQILEITSIKDNMEAITSIKEGKILKFNIINLLIPARTNNPVLETINMGLETINMGLETRIPARLTPSTINLLQEKTSSKCQQVFFVFFTNMLWQLNKTPWKRW